MEKVAVLVKVLHVNVHDVGSFDRIARLPSLLDRAAGLEIAHANAVERLTLARLDHLVLDDGVRLALEKDLEAGLELVGAVGRHGGTRGGAARAAVE